MEQGGACRASFALHFACGETALAGHRPHRGRYFAVPVTAAPRRGPNGKTPALVAVRLHFACAKPRGRTFPRRGQRARCPIFALLKCGPAFSRGVCRGTFLCSTAGPALAPRRLSPFGSISLRETALAGRFPRRGQRARCPIFALLKCGPAFSRGVCQGTFLCSTAGPAVAPRRLSPFGSISLRETALAGRCPHRGQRARYPIFALLKCGPAFSRGVCRGTFLCSTAGPALAPRRSAPFHPKTIVRFRMSVSPEFSVFFICPPPFFCIGSGAHRYTKIRGGDTPPRI
ncbi:hypothetical protein HMPREF1032_03915 [Subdoligranulum sp. 4_3_54A2FAA]|nr:hypothetical protein HMPREF1032_03915 [Subdoligranulum sp. 4_3_54A2FAA]